MKDEPLHRGYLSRRLMLIIASNWCEVISSRASSASAPAAALLVDRISSHASVGKMSTGECSIPGGALSGILNRQSRAERQNTFDWLHILPVTVTISQYKSYSANGSYILSILVIFYQPE